MDKLQQLLNRCKCGVHLTVNAHRDVYETAEATIEEDRAREWLPDIAPEVLAEMIRTDTIVQLQFYPDTPIGFYVIWHHSLDAALTQALACLSEDSK